MKSIKVVLIVLLSLCLSSFYQENVMNKVIQDMVKSMLKKKWSKEFKRKNRYTPQITIAAIANKTHQHLPLEDLRYQLKAHLEEESRLNITILEKNQLEYLSILEQAELAQKEDADFILFGEINAMVDEHKHKTITDYRITMELRNIKTRKIVWTHDKDWRYVTNKESKKK